MSSFVNRARRYHRAIREILLREWDPIGVAHIPEAQDEYDPYVPSIHRMLITHKPKCEVFDYLWWLETEHMGLIGDRQRAENIAERLIRLRDDFEEE